MWWRCYSTPFKELGSEETHGDPSVGSRPKIRTEVKTTAEPKIHAGDIQTKDFKMLIDILQLGENTGLCEGD